MSPEAILGGTNNIRGEAPMKVSHSTFFYTQRFIIQDVYTFMQIYVGLAGLDDEHHTQ